MRRRVHVCIFEMVVSFMLENARGCIAYKIRARDAYTYVCITIYTHPMQGTRIYHVQYIDS